MIGEFHGSGSAVLRLLDLDHWLSLPARAGIAVRRAITSTATAATAANCQKEGKVGTLSSSAKTRVMHTGPAQNCVDQGRKDCHREPDARLLVVLPPEHARPSAESTDRRHVGAPFSDARSCGLRVDAA